MHHQALTSEIIFAVLWLGKASDDNTGVPVGSGVVVHHRGNEYLATAYHVSEACSFNPLIRHSNRWHRIKWNLVLADETRDLTVFKTVDRLANITPKYGVANTVYGSLGRALGFPAFDNQLLNHVNDFGEMDGHPLPITAVVSATVAIGTGDFDYAGGYVNSGFSGGAIVFPTTDSSWTIAGIIIERGAVIKEIGQDKQGQPLFIVEPTGIVKFVRMSTVLELIDKEIESSGTG